MLISVLTLREAECRERWLYRSPIGRGGERYNHHLLEIGINRSGQTKYMLYEVKPTGGAITCIVIVPPSLR